MLILTRKIGEKINLHDADTGKLLCEFSIVDFSRALVRLGIDAGPEVIVARPELGPEFVEARMKRAK